MADEDVISETRDGVSIIRINRPDKRNAMNRAVMAGIGAGMAAADESGETRVVVLTGTGEKAFCAGMDLADFAKGDIENDDSTAEGLKNFNRFVKGQVATPVICAANGSAVAGGFELLMACDIVVAADHATFGLPEVKRGLFAAGGGVFLSKRIALAKALEMAMTGDPIDADEASRLGLVNRVVPAVQVMEEAMALADTIAANGPLAVAATKQLVRAASTDATDDVYALQAELQPKIFGSEDAKEGASAFVEKRAPVWKAR